VCRRGDGAVEPGDADLILVDGDPLADITVLQDQQTLNYIMKDGRFHKETGDAPAHAARLGPHRLPPGGSGRCLTTDRR
jgi:hypothetical protein